MIRTFGTGIPGSIGARRIARTSARNQLKYVFGEEGIRKAPASIADFLGPREETVREWVATRWPFERVTYGERDR